MTAWGMKTNLGILFEAKDEPNYKMLLTFCFLKPAKLKRFITLKRLAYGKNILKTSNYIELI